MPQLLILGMHRSGTSLVAGYCAAAGVYPGRPAEMLAAGSDNPEGFFEHRDLVKINDDVLANAGASWSNPKNIVALPTEHLRLAAEALVASLGAEHGQFLLKDPRLCLTAAAWAPLLSRPAVVYVFRPALAVARSLAARNNFPLQLGFLLWEFYNRAALRLALDADNAFALSYDAIISDGACLEGLARWLQERGFNCTTPEAKQIVKRELRHAVSDAQDPAAELMTSEQQRLQEQCEAFCRGELPGEVSPMTEAALHRLSDLASSMEPLARVIETGIAREEAERLGRERTAERDRSLATLNSLQRDHEALAKAHDEERGLHARAAAALTDLEEQHRELAVAHEQEVATHRALFDKYKALSSEYDELVVSNENLSDKVDYLFVTLTERYRDLLVFEQSTLARLQGRLRSAYRFVTRRRGQNSRYEDLLEHAHAHFSEYSLDKPQRPPTKIDMLGDVVGYVLRNPAGSARSFSWPRLKRAVQVFFGSSSADLAVWVNARFPGDTEGHAAFDPQSLDASLDDLELVFPTAEAPRVSIIVPVFNDYRMTVNCLRSVLEHSRGISYEVIIADDCSTDLTTSIEERIHNITVSRTPENLRFLRNCNLAAELARGEALLFLNNDTEVTAGWLEALLDPLAQPDVAVVGPKLLFADGRLQEAGGIVWRDGSAWNFGRADDPGLPAYNYRRDVDYVSGACLLIRRSAWNELGGFDERYAPAYYEDADLCFEARKAGYRVVYQPRSSVFHFEGVSNGTDLDSGVKRHQVTNQQTFLAKWQRELEASHFPNGEHVLLARDRSRGKPRVLVIDHYVPHYDKDAGGRSTDQYLQLFLRMGWQVQFMGANFFPHQPYTERLEAMGIEVLVGERIARGLDRWLRENCEYLDEIWVHRPHVAEQFLPHLERLPVKPTIVFVGHDLHYLRSSREASLRDDPGLAREAESWKQRELAVCARVDRVCYFSGAEIEELSLQITPEKLRRIPLYCTDVPELPAYQPSRPSAILFVGGYNHPPNVDAAVWLAGEILPLVREQVADAELHLVGSNPTQEVLALAGERVTVHGFISDEALAQMYRDVALAVVPLRYGAGVKGKVIEAVANNVPVITTDIGAEGLPDADDVMWVKNTAGEIAECAVEVLKGNSAVATRMSSYSAWLEANFAAARAIESIEADMLASTEKHG